ncbi:PaaI family thioesterase [Vibrio sp. TRT 21S02]|uniref:PaaI family thioesterase n=1 Tax=Vibrio sp. TRT 21S02 TaxID=3418507 RepID=UPI003CF66FA9
MLSPLNKANLYLKCFGFFKVPLIWLCRPKIIKLNSQSVEVKIPLRRRTKNHLNSMYFGVLAVGADVAGGFMAMSKAQSRGSKVSLAFKVVEGHFLKRPEADVHFICNDGALIDDMLDQTISSGERVNEVVKITAICPTLHGMEPMAEFDLTLSLKRMD